MNLIEALEETSRLKLDEDATASYLVEQLGMEPAEAEDTAHTAHGGSDVVYEEEAK